METNCTNVTNCTEGPIIDFAKGFTLLLILCASAVGNILTLCVLLRLKETRIPDILVVSLAITDLVATVIPIPMSLYSYFTGVPFSEGSVACNVYGTVAQWTRYTSAILVTLISLDRYLSIAYPVMYSTRVRKWHIVAAIVLSTLISTALAVVPWISPDTTILTGDAICLFSFVEPYAYVIVVYAGVQFVIVLYCFTATVYNLCRIYRRRRKMKLQGERNIMSSASFSSGPTFTKPGLSSRINDLNKSVKKAAPLLGESLKLSIEAQFARMLLAITALFYLSWLPIVSLVVYALAVGMETEEGQREALFWAIRFTVVSTAINPIMYGLLCRQYRQLYIYLFRKIFHCCCSCVREPYYNPFKHRDHPPKSIEAKMKRDNHRKQAPPPERLRFFGSYRSLQSFYSQMSQESSYSRQPLTRATTRTNISLPRLFGIEEEMSSFNETSTHLPTAGDLNSTVVISEYARRHGNQTTNEDQPFLHARSASFGNFEAAGTYFDTSVNPALLGDGSLHRINPLMDVELDGVEEETIIFPGDYLERGMYGGEVHANPVFSLASVKGDDSRRLRQKGSAWLDRHVLERAATSSKVPDVMECESSSSEESGSEEEEEESSGSESAAFGVEEAMPHSSGRMHDRNSTSEEGSSVALQQEMETNELVEVGGSESSEELSEHSTDREEQDRDVVPQMPAVVPTTVPLSAAEQNEKEAKMNTGRTLPKPLPPATVSKFRTDSILPSSHPPLKGPVNELDLAGEFEEIEKLLQSVTSELSPLKY